MSLVPKEPQRRSQLGFLYLPPFRIQGISVAGEETVVQVPELDICFDIGKCPRTALASNVVALSHGHMDHSAGVAYYFSQRWFQGMGEGTMLCPKALEGPIHGLMRAWIDVEAQRTPYTLIGMEPDQEIEVKNKRFVRAFATNHTAPSLGYVVLERRSKLRPEFNGLPPEELIALKRKGTEITHTFDVPLIAYTGDTAWGSHFERPDVLGASILITECTFLEPEHRSKADIGKHLHISQVAELVRASKAEAVVLTHLSRRTQIQTARKQIAAALRPEDRDRVYVLMDRYTNRRRLDSQQDERAS